MDADEVNMCLENKGAFKKPAKTTGGLDVFVCTAVTPYYGMDNNPCPHHGESVKVEGIVNGKGEIDEGYMPGDYFACKIRTLKINYS